MLKTSGPVALAVQEREKQTSRNFSYMSDSPRHLITVKFCQRIGRSLGDMHDAP